MDASLPVSVAPSGVATAALTAVVASPDHAVSRPVQPPAESASCWLAPPPAIAVAQGGVKRFCGTSFVKANGKWIAELCGGGKRRLGAFDDEADAARAWDKAVRAAGGKTVNFPLAESDETQALPFVGRRLAKAVPHAAIPALFVGPAPRLLDATAKEAFEALRAAGAAHTLKEVSKALVAAFSAGSLGRAACGEGHARNAFVYAHSQAEADAAGARRQAACCRDVAGGVAPRAAAPSSGDGDGTGEGGEGAGEADDADVVCAPLLSPPCNGRVLAAAAGAAAATAAAAQQPRQQRPGASLSPGTAAAAPATHPLRAAGAGDTAAGAAAPGGEPRWRDRSRPRGRDRGPRRRLRSLSRSRRRGGRSQSRDRRRRRSRSRSRSRSPRRARRSRSAPRSRAAAAPPAPAPAGLVYRSPADGSLVGPHGLGDFRFWLQSNGGAFRDALLDTRVWPAGGGATAEAAARTLRDVLCDAGVEGV